MACFLWKSKNDEDTGWESLAAPCPTYRYDEHIVDGSVIPIHSILRLGMYGFGYGEGNEIRLLTPEGVVVEGEFRIGSSDILFKPKQPLAYDAEYIFELRYCDFDGHTPQLDRISFRTEPLLNTGNFPVTGQSFRMDMSSGNSGEWIRLLDYLVPLFENQLLWSIFTIGGNEISMVSTVTEPLVSEQDFCVDTNTLSGSLDSGVFHFTDVELQLDGNGDFVLHSADIYGQLSADGTGLVDMQIEGRLDVRNSFIFFQTMLPNLAESVETPQELCEELVGLSMPCTPCDSDQEEFCVDIYWQSLEGQSWDDGVEEVCEGYCHELCGTSVCALPQVTDAECP